MAAQATLRNQAGMDELCQLERKRRGLNAQSLGNHPGRQPRRPGGNEQSEQRKPGFLSECAERCDRVFFVHRRDFYDSTTIKYTSTLALQASI